MKVTRAKGHGQGSCKRCEDNGKWNRMWMTFLNEIEGKEGLYCDDCVKEMSREINDRNIEIIELELATIKCMIFSLYKIVTGDKDFEKLSDWESECKEIAKELLSDEENN